MAEVIRYVDPDATGTGDGTSWTDAYTSLSAWNAAEATDLVTAGNWHHVYCRSSSGTADTTAAVIFDWTTGADNYILIEAATGDEAVKDGWKTTRYRLDVAGSTAIENKESYVRIKGLQIRSTGDSDFVLNLAYWGTNTSDIRVDACRIRGDGTTNDITGIYGYDTDPDPAITVTNCVITDCKVGIKFSDGQFKIYNNVIYGASTDTVGYRGIWIEVDCNSIVIKNNAILNNYDDIYDAGATTVTIDYNASDDGDGTNSVSPDSSDWDNEFNDPANGDFTLLNTGNLYDAGVGPGTDSDVPSTDIDGDSRSGTTCDIGADEYVSSGTTYSVTVTDGISLSDSVSGALTIPVSITDGLTFSDSTGGVLDIPMTLADGISLSDSASGALKIPVTISDGIVLTDEIAAAFTFRISIDDGIVLSDQATEGGVISVTIADGVVFSDSASASIRMIESISDGVVFSDSVSGALTIEASISDGVSFSDAINTAFRYLVSISDGITLSDVVVDSSVLASGKVSVTISAKTASITITAKKPTITITAKRPNISFDAN